MVRKFVTILIRLIVLVMATMTLVFVVACTQNINSIVAERSDLFLVSKSDCYAGYNENLKGVEVSLTDRGVFRYNRPIDLGDNTSFDEFLSIYV